MMLTTLSSTPSSSCDDDGYHGSPGMEMDITMQMQLDREVDLLDFLGPDGSSPEPEEVACLAGPVVNSAVDEQNLEPTLFYGYNSDSSCEFEDVSASLFQFRTPTLTTPSSPGLKRDYFFGVANPYNTNSTTNNITNRSSSTSKRPPNKLRAAPQSRKSSSTVFQFPDCYPTPTHSRRMRNPSSSSSSSSTVDEMSTENLTNATRDSTTTYHNTSLNTSKAYIISTPLHVPEVSSRKNEHACDTSAPNTPPQQLKAPIIPPLQQSKRSVQTRQSQRQRYHTTGTATVTFATTPRAAKSKPSCNARMKHLPLAQTSIALLLPEVDLPELGDLNGKMPRPAVVQAPPRRRKKNEKISADELARETEERKSKSVQSARDCRQRKKQYIGRLQNAINQYNQRERTAQNLITSLQNQLIELQRVSNQAHKLTT
eukprot:m.55809 g.55809  ORF g.55809 m.55809 type:complete len:428 (+) comp22135_c0_seq1:436-1719(+)